MSSQTPVLRLEGIVKTFPGVRALDGVSFSVMPGEVHALMGENGAGKSTSMKVLGGLYQPDEGTIYVDEVPTIMSSPLDAKAKGIVFIHQELSLADELSVAENVGLPCHFSKTRAERARQRHGSVAQASASLAPASWHSEKPARSTCRSAVDWTATARRRGARTDRAAGTGDRRRTHLCPRRR